MNNRINNRRWHWAFWGIYLIINHLVFSQDLFSRFDLFVNFLFLIHNAGAAYVTLDYWIPYLYKKKQYARFLIMTFITCLFFGGLLLLTLLALFSFFDSIEGNLQLFIEPFYPAAFWSHISAVTLILIPYFVLQRTEMERRNQQLEKEKLAAELKFLKSQLHPHFLFNALNNIYFLIKKDPDTAAEALAGFSNLLRFQLYEANQTYVFLEKEIAYLQQFAEIAQLRKGENFKVSWQLPDTIEQVQIPPLLLMPLLENAFKHGSPKNGYIDIEVNVQNDQLHFTIKNSIATAKTQELKDFKEHGIGLVNIKKRLDLLYANQYEWTIKETPETFMVAVQLPINHPIDL